MLQRGSLRRPVAVAALAAGILLSACGGDDDDAPGASPSSQPPASATPAPVTPAPGDHELTLIHDGTPRTYLLHAPPSYERGKPMALVLALHGRPSSPNSIRTVTGLSEKADEAGFIVVYPEGTGGGWVVVGAGTDDVDFISDLIDEVERTWGTDPGRVYVTGFSNGAQMTFRLASALSDRLAAVAPISGAVRSRDILPSSPISVLSITGTDDPGANYAARDILASWQQAMGCRPPVEEAVEIGGRSMTTTRAECEADTEIIWHSVDGMGHSWPGSSGGSLSANDMMWEFFEAHVRSSTR